MTLHKLTAGDGYTYLTRQVAVVDSTERGRAGLADYYTERGESPGRWVGSALADVDLTVGDVVTEAQMLALFGEGRHPNADQLVEDAIRAAVNAAAGAGAAGDAGPGLVDVAAITAGTQLGQPFPVHAAAPRFRVLVARRVVAANLARGAQRDTPMDAADRAEIRTQVGREMFTAAHGRDPLDARELSSFIASQDRAATTAVAGYDLTFTPVKSVSALWAIAPRPVAEAVRDAHRAAVADALSWLETTAVYTRGGAGGVQQLDTTGMIAAAFEHRDSRAGDPNLHTHVAVSNKVRVRHLDGTHGRWLALDGRVLHKAAVCASERYNTRLEAELHARLGLNFSPRPDPTGHPPSATDGPWHAGHGGLDAARVVREIDGIPAQLLALWSTRRGQIDARRAVLAAAFVDRHARVPTPVEAVKLAQQATLETRDAKHEPRTEAEQRATWGSEAATLLGSPAAVTAVVDRLVTRRAAREQPARPGGVDPAVTGQLVAATVAVLAAARATWQCWHVRAEAERQARAHPATTTLTRAEVDALVEQVVATVLAPAISVALSREDPAELAAGGTPEPLRRADGTSVYQVAGSRLYTSEAILAAEQVILDAAARTDGHRIGDTHVDVALLEALANGVALNDAQAHLVRALTTSGARVQVAIAPAGSGKTTALATLTRAWTAAGATIIGLAPSAAAASVLRENLTPTHGTPPHTDTVAKLVWHLTHDTGQPRPHWIARIDSRTLILIDEAAMAATTDLAHVVSFALARGASVRLVGDDAQLASIAAGGVLRDIAATHGAVTLSELVRFTDPAEAAAGLAIRDGDPAGIGFYLDTHRVHVGDLATVTDIAYTGWASDRAAGRDTIMLAPTRELVAQLNARARHDRLTTGGADPPSAVVTLADGTHACVGDLVITRRNDRRLRIWPTDWVSNGQRWRVRHVYDDGRLSVQDLANPRRRVTLPADYVAAHVRLGYASTIHAAQGLTADTSHTVLTGGESRQQLYVALTRGRNANHLHLAMAGDGAEHSIIRPDSTRPPTAGDLLERIVTRDEAAHSATTTARTVTDPATTLHQAATRYRDALATAAVHTLGGDWVSRIDTLADQSATALTGRTLTDQPAWPTLRAHLAWHTLTGADPAHLLTAAATARQTGTAHDLAAVLDWRLDPTHHRPAGQGPGPLPWLAAIPTALATHPQWGAYLTARREHVTSATAAVTAAATGWTPASTPGWARPFHHTGCDQLRTRLAVFRAAHAVPDTDTRPTGPTQVLAADRSVQRALTAQVADTIDTSYRDTWTATAAAIGLRPGTDPHWPALLDQLADLSRAGIDAATLLRRTVTQAPLPDEYVAAAIRWRITRHTTTTTATTTTGADLLRPAWLPTLTGAVGPHLAERLTADPRWPALVAAITRAAGHGITHQDLLVHPLDLDGAPVPEDALADALIYRAATLSRPEPADPDHEPNPDEHTPPDDLLDPLLPGVLEAPPPGHPDLDTPPPDDVPDPVLHGPGQVPQDGDTWPLGADAQLALAGIIRAGLPAWTPTDAQIAQQLERAYEADTAPVSPERIHALNEQAAAFYQGCYPGSWSAAYLAARLGVDPAPDPSIRPGHAPAAWTALTDHLRRHGASDEELLAAGLAKPASTGRLIDTFRDRLILPIHTTTPTGACVIVGFVARRNPRHDQHDNPLAGPKYLNTGRTVAYTKGEHLYGVADARDRLLDGATPVLVEGPIDALAITLASPRHVGLAPLGTALTDSHADTLIPYLTRPDGLIIATDPDPAGRAAAERDYWMLTARGGEPRHAQLPAGLDPADLLSHHGPDPLHAILTHATPLGDALIDTRRLATGGTATLHEAVLVTAAGDQPHWATRAQRIAAHLHLPYESVVGALYEHINTWDGDRAIAAHRAETATLNAIRDRQTRLHAQPPHQRWAPLAGQLHPTLPEHPHWPALAQSFQQAHDDGVNLHALLTDPAGPLDPGDPLRDLATRLDAQRPLHPRTPPAGLPTDVPPAGDSAEAPLQRAARRGPMPCPPTAPHR